MNEILSQARGNLVKILTYRLQIFYTCQSALGWSIGNSANGLANNNMTPAQRASLSPDSQEYQMRYVSEFLGAKSS